MGSGGTEWESNDNFDPIRLNQKTTFVGTGSQINTFISTPQVGQKAFSLESGNGFLFEKLSIYKSTSEWNKPSLDEQSEESSGDSTAGVGNTISGDRFYRFITLPSTYKFYIITALEFFQSTTGKVVHMGADIVDSATPTIDSTVLVALSEQFTTSSANTVKKLTQVVSRPVRGGTLLGVWVVGGSADAFECDNTDGYGKLGGFSLSTAEYADSTSWTFGGGIKPPKVKVYYRGYD